MIRVLLVTPVRFYAEGICHLLRSHTSVEIVETAVGADDGLRAARALKPDVALIDVSVTGATSIARAIFRSHEGTKVVALALREEDGDVMAWAEAGICGYVTRDASAEELVSTIVSVSRGEMSCSPRITARLLRRVATLASFHPALAAIAPLTAREREVANLIGAGLSNKEIASHLVIGLPTVKNHVHHIYEKLHVSKRSEASTWARREFATDTGDNF